jgi:O-methyltransferase involved in polyketide biosynthesis
MSEKTAPHNLLGATARWTAGVRAIESQRSDRLFNDPWAAALAGEEGEDWAKHKAGESGIGITMRIRFFDDFLLHVTGEYVTSMAAVGSWLGLDVVNSAMFTSPWTRDWIQSLEAAGTPWCFAMDDPEAFLAARNWTAHMTQAGEENAHFGRWPYPVPPHSIPNMPYNWLVTAQYKA